jgi:hypothetical protein
MRLLCAKMALIYVTGSISWKFITKFERDIIIIYPNSMVPQYYGPLFETLLEEL